MVGGRGGTKIKNRKKKKLTVDGEEEEDDYDEEGKIINLIYQTY